MPAKVSENIRPMVMAGLAKLLCRDARADNDGGQQQAADELRRQPSTQPD